MALSIEFIGDAGGPNRVDSIRPVEMRALPSDPLADFSARSGLWVELRDSSGRVLYRRVMHDSTRYMEGPADAGGRSITRTSPPDNTSALRIVVPQLPEAREAVLVRSRTERDRAIDVVKVSLP